MHALETYLRDLSDIRSTGAAVKETSYYPPLANLLNTVGQTLKPRVRCVINLKNQGAGMPDGGLFTLEGVRPQVVCAYLRFPVRQTGCNVTLHAGTLV
jgi:hypothetical protein